MKEYKLKSQILNQERKITIYKPPVLAKYKDAVSPVLYVLDGELAAYYYCTMVNYLCERIPQCPPITVVGIENDSLSKIYGYRMKPDEDVINNYGYIFLNQEKDVDKALEFFKKNIENYPQSSNVYDSYAEALLVKGDKKNALINYEKAFKMDSTNTNARDIIIKMREEK